MSTPTHLEEAAGGVSERERTREKDIGLMQMQNRRGLREDRDLFFRGRPT